MSEFPPESMPEPRPASMPEPQPESRPSGTVTPTAAPPAPAPPAPRPPSRSKRPGPLARLISLIITVGLAWALTVAITAWLLGLFLTRG